MVEAARLEKTGAGLVAASDGWFVVNVGDAAWLRSDAFGLRCIFETDGRIVRERPDLHEVRFRQLGIRLAVVYPGQPSGMYHAETAQEGFLVLAGECLLLVEGEERSLRAWDFFHCPAGTEHIFVGAGDGRCVILMVGARPAKRSIVYPVSDLAQRHGAGVEQETNDPGEAYAPFPHWRPERPSSWTGFPWG
jgi:uncharacterized cupin superfamily protein